MNHRSRPLALALAGAVAGITLLATSGTASAHVTIAEGEVTAGSYAILTFGLPHGCGEEATNEMRIQIPESMPSVTPTVNPKWEVEKVMEPLDEPVEAGHGQMLTERVAEVVYTTDDPLPADLRDKFELSVRIPDDAAGQTLYFPTVQICGDAESAWIEIPAEGEDPFSLEMPSPFVTVVAAEGDGHGHSHGSDEEEHAADDAAMAEEVAVGDGEAAGAAEAAPEVASASADDDGTDPLTIVALVVGALGLVAGGVAIVRTRSVSTTA
jgi:uncharacterized protein YcnI